MVDSDLRDFNASDLAVLEAVSEKVVFIGIFAMHCLTGQIIPAGEL